MESKVDLERLENIVEKLLTSYNDLKAEKQRLERSLMEKDAEIIKLDGELQGLTEEKAGIHNRVSGLIASIEEWEKEHAEAVVVEPEEEQPAAKENEGGRGANRSEQLFGMGD